MGFSGLLFHLLSVGGGLNCGTNIGFRNRLLLSQLLGFRYYLLLGFVCSNKFSNELPAVGYGSRIFDDTFTEI